MPGHLTTIEIEEQLTRAANELSLYCSSLTDQQFFYQPDNKWSVAQQVKHLTTSTRAAGLAFTLPKFLVRWVGGKPNRPSRDYDELVAKYKLKLAQGGQASGRYVPKPIPTSYGKEKLLNKFSISMNKMAHSIKKNWKGDQPDRFIVPHPLLGKVTLRELCYFTIYHTYHHLESISNLANR